MKARQRRPILVAMRIYLPMHLILRVAKNVRRLIPLMCVYHWVIPYYIMTRLERVILWG